jgi:hypothetical protein
MYVSLGDDMNELVNSLVSIKLSVSRLHKEVGIGMAHKLLAIDRLVNDVALRHNVSEEVDRFFFLELDKQ